MTTIVHIETFTDAMKRAVAGMIDDVPEEYYKLARAYHDTKIPPELQ